MTVSKIKKYELKNGDWIFTRGHGPTFFLCSNPNPCIYHPRGTKHRDNHTSSLFHLYSLPNLLQFHVGSGGDAQESQEQPTQRCQNKGPRTTVLFYFLYSREQRDKEREREGEGEREKRENLKWAACALATASDSDRKADVWTNWLCCLFRWTNER